MKKIYSRLMMSAILAGAALSASAQTPVITPVREAQTKLSYVTFTFGENDVVTLVDDSKECGVIIPGDMMSTWPRVISSIEEGEGGKDNIVIVGVAGDFGSFGELTNDYKTPDSYNFGIQPGTIKVNGVTVNTPIQKTYKIYSEEAYAAIDPEKYNVQPKSDVLEAIDKIVVTFPNAKEVKEAGYPNASITDSDGGGVFRLITSVTGNAFTIEVKDPIKVAGNYIVTIPAAALIVDGDILANDIVLQYSVVNDGPSFEASVTPAPGTVFDFGNQIFAEFKDGQVLDYKPTGTDACIYLQKATGDGSYERVITFMETMTSVKSNTISLTISPEVEITSGEYQLVFAEGCYTLDGIKGDEIVLDYTVKAVTPAFAPKAKEVTELTTIEVSFPGFTEVKEFTEAMAVAKLVNAANGEFASQARCSVIDNVATFAIVDAASLVAGQSYTLTIDPYFFELDGLLYGKGIQNTWFYMPEAPAFTDSVAPAAGSKFTSLSTVTVAIAPAVADETIVVAAAEIETSNAPYLTVDGTRMATAQKFDITDNVMTIDFGTFAEAGAVEVIVPGAAYTVNGIPGSDLVYDYTIATVKYSVSPKANEITEGEFKGITLTFAEGAEVKELGYSTYLVDVAGDSHRVYTSVKDNAYIIDAIDSLTTGVYTFIIPANTLSVDGVVITDIMSFTKSYTPDVPELAYTATPSSGSTVAELSVITVAFAEGSEVVLVEGETTQIMPKVIDADGWPAYLFGYSAAANVLTIDISANPFKAEGPCSIVIPGKGYTVNGEAGFDIVLNYTIDPEAGIATITTANGSAIYTVSGVKVAKAVRGINIINGKKVIVK